MTHTRFALSVAAGLAVGCDEVLGEPSLVEDLRVLATTTAPCAPLADNGAQLAVAVADPDQLGASVAAWICPPEDGVDCWFARMDPVDGVARAPFVTGSTTDLWVAACDPAVCDLDQLGQDQAALRDPQSWLATLPLAGVSAATRPLTVRPDDGSTAEPQGCTNPALRSQPNRESIAVAAAGAEVALRFEVTGAGLAYAWTTAGRFTAPEYGIAEDGSVVATWEAPEEPGPVQLFVVFVETAPSAFGAVQPTEGAAVWAATATVQ